MSRKPHCKLRGSFHTVGIALYLVPRALYPCSYMNLDAIQSALRDARIDAWLFYDHHHRDPLAAAILGLPDTGLVSRRWYYVVPAEGEPRKLVHRIEAGKLDTLPGSKGVYSSWQELESGLQAMLSPWKRIAMQ
jgi:Xaa-Pro dipeptidase